MAHTSAHCTCGGQKEVHQVGCICDTICPPHSSLGTADGMHPAASSVTSACIQLRHMMTLWLACVGASAVCAISEIGYSF